MQAQSSWRALPSSGAARSMLTASFTPPCSERYLKLTMFSLERGGAMLTSTDLQAMSGGRDAGVQNVSIVRKAGPAPLAVEVNLQKGSAGREDGMGFPWEPRILAGKTAACLSYHVYLPKDFDFRRSGKLPGFAGGAEQTDAFVAPIIWDAIGRAASPCAPPSGPGAMAQAEVRFPRAAGCASIRKWFSTRPRQATASCACGSTASWRSTART